MSWIVLSYRGDHCRMLISEGVTARPSLIGGRSQFWSEFLWLLIATTTTISAGGCAHAHVGWTGYKCNVNSIVNVKDKNACKPCQKWQFRTLPFWSGSCLPHSKTRDVTFAIREKERESSLLLRGPISWMLPRCWTENFHRGDAYTSQHWSEGIKQGLI